MVEYNDFNKDDIKLKHTIGEKIIIAITLMLSVGNFVYLFMNWSNIPDVVPTHFGVSGMANDFGSKNSLLLSPIMATLLSVGMIVLSYFPKAFNIPVTLNRENIKREYKLGRDLLLVIALEISAFFLYVEVQNIRIALERVKSLGGAFIVIELVVIFFTVAFYIFKMVKAKKSS